MSRLQILTYMSYDTTDSKFRAFLNQTTTIPNYLLLSPLEPLAMTINDQWFEANFSQSEAKEYRYSKQEKKTLVSQRDMKTFCIRYQLLPVISKITA